MTREQRLKLCEMCAYCKRDIQRGMVCGLTNEYAAFEGDCPQFVASQYYLAQERAEMAKSDNDADDGVNLPLLAMGILCLFVFYAFLLDGSTQPIRLLLATGSILLATALVMLAYGYVKGRKAQQSARRAIPLNLAIIEKIVRAEGYCPQIVSDNQIVFKRQGEAYIINYNESKFALRYYFPIETNSPNAHLVAMWVMDEMVMVKVCVRKDDDNPTLQNITLSVENCIGTVEELLRYFATYVAIIEEAARRFLHGISLMHQHASDEQADNEPPYRDEVVAPALYWLPQLGQAYCDSVVSIDALADEAWIRETIQQKIPEEARSLWESFRIERVEQYGDYRLYIYRFPEPQAAPEAKYGALLVNTTEKAFVYYTLECANNGKWAYGGIQGEAHRNYSEVDTDDLDAFIAWILCHDKHSFKITDCANEHHKTIN